MIEKVVAEKILSDREVLTLAFGALAVSTDENLQQVKALVAEHLFGKSEDHRKNNEVLE